MATNGKKKVVTFGEIMLRLAPPENLRFIQANSFDVVYGGGESNVAVSLANYGLPTEFVTRLPENDLGECALATLRKHNVGTNHIKRGGERLGIYFLETGAVARASNVVYDRAHSSMATIESGMIDWDEVLADAGWFHFTGITPALSQGAADACAEAIEAANRLGVPVSTDLNYRKKLWNYGKTAGEVMEGLVAGCDVILGNEEDVGGERLGIYFLETGAVARASNVVYDRAHSSMATIESGMIDWDEVLADAGWFHFTGITPALSQGAADACAEAIEAANRLGVPVSTDLNYRKKLWNYGKTAGEVMEGLVAGCDVILGNEEDAEKVFGIHPEGADVTSGEVDAASYESVGRQMMERFPRARKIVITLRGSISASHNTWSGVMWTGERLLTAPTYEITHIVDRVGGGDSFMGGLIYGLLTYPDDDERALRFAVAASCLKHTIYGDFNLVSVDEVEKLMSGDASGRVSR